MGWLIYLKGSLKVVSKLVLHEMPRYTAMF